MFQWASRCAPGLSILALLLLSYVAFADVWYYFTPPQDKHQHLGPPHHCSPPCDRTDALPLAQKIFIVLSLFVHLNAFYFSVRLFFALVKTLRESRKALGRRSSIESKLLESVQDDIEYNPQGAISLNAVEAELLEANLRDVFVKKEVIHAIIIPNYKEDIDTLRVTLQVLAIHPRASTQYEIYLAMEQRETEAADKATKLLSMFEGAFLHIRATFHPSGIPGEIAGKSSNVAYAAQHIIDVHAIDNDDDMVNILITVVDADTHLLQDYFNELRRLHFDNLASPEESFYCCPIIFDRNSVETPVLVRCADLMWGFAGISAMYPGSPISIPTSVYTVPLLLAKKAGGWDSDASAIGEDMHMMLKCYFATKANITTRVVYSAASQCNISSNDNRGWRLTVDILVKRYRQALRHMWGALDTGFAIRKSVDSLTRPGWPLFFNRKQWALAHLLWEAHFLPSHLILILLISSSYSTFALPHFVHPVLARTSRLTGLLRLGSFTMMNICMIVYHKWHHLCVSTRYMDMEVANFLEGGFSFRHWWDRGPLLDRVVFPLAGVLFGPIPAIHAVFSHFWTDQLVYQVSQKPSFKKAETVDL
ncbi:hypothetical protein NFIA_039750 [Paecilomyces variotii No. 5]|uniref:Glycosyltransferase 2-like domain-containing protein n=1 Tax=Byssochlamys spectabilis (strain No. 5 / NBRC 109023) TaxID=1356009 RepID=V5G3E0_BYSSN|nr:hypothetical protein NFIA_039750 [Paecilomyces variotii No. 5]